ncbi:MAG TPA: response regulator transcription factor [Thermohalobaculum sp.]|nr:response regulator transcription factor [Thermohalobaculum sp.]
MQSDSRPISVLIADDHQMILDMLSVFLSTTHDIAIETAGDLDDAIALVGEHGAFDVVLLDYNMAGMNGLSGLTRMQCANKGGRIGIFTGSPTKRMLDDAISDICEFRPPRRPDSARRGHPPEPGTRFSCSDVGWTRGRCG